MNRRDFIKASAALGAALGRRADVTATESSAVSGATGLPHRGPSEGSNATILGASQRDDPLRADYVVVGSGAGGGTVAARLAEAGYTVLVLEAGGDPATVTGSNPVHPGQNTYPEDYTVPAFHGLATENDAMKWDFFVRHYDNDAQQRKDDKYVEEYLGKRVDGIWYPRAGTVGGCTAHNAMIFVYPQNSDWNELADLTGDRTWRAEHMRSYFERLEHCDHRPFQRFLSRLGANPTRHGWGGWLHIETPQPKDAIRDRQVRAAIATSISARLKTLGFPTFETLESLGDPNDWRRIKVHAEGACYVPLTTRKNHRAGTRERLEAVRRRYPNRLRIETDALASKVLFDGTRATGVEYLKGAHVYQADPKCMGAAGDTRTALAAREVILAGGAFNTPQLLMLSGIGPRDVLAANRIAVRLELDGVGRNLQDRYEVAVVNRTFRDWDVLQGATLSKNDRQYRDWQDGRGVYTTNGVLLSVIARSSPKQPVPDLFCYAVLADLRGYVPNYTKQIQSVHNAMTWIVLKAHTNNRGGRVTLRSTNPREVPKIAFHYFKEGTDAGGEDLDAVVAGVKLVRSLTEPLKANVVQAELSPGPACNTDDKLKEFVTDQTWGHHASCTCAIGPADRGGVLTSDFRVHGTQGLRVVDASVFPRAPGLFIVSAVYMVGEKAADVIAASAKRNVPARRP